MERRLAAILAADMVGYSRLMEADEEGTIARQKARRGVEIDPEIAKHHGRIVKTTGDGILAEFASVVDAVKCAVAIQRAMAGCEADVPEERRIRYRIGINSGDIVIDGDDILGDGVNVAARLEGLADPGGICIPRKVMQEVVGKLDVGFEFTGEQEVKNIRTPVPAYRVLLDPAAAGTVIDGSGASGRSRRYFAAATAALVAAAVGVAWWQPWAPGVELAPQEGTTASLAEKPSVAVLPFNNMSEDEDQEYFADGMTEDLITDLAKVSGLLVIARNSTFAYKGRSPDVREVARELDVQYVVEGSVRRAGGRIRINAQLIDAEAGTHLWAERYDREATDIFDLQDEVRAQIVAALQVKLTPSEQDRLTRHLTDNPEAYDYYMRGQQLESFFNKESNLESQRMFERAIQLAPNFAVAIGKLATAHTLAAEAGWSPAPEESLETARLLAEKAVKLDDSLPEAHWAVARVYSRARLFDGERAIASLRKALALDPNYADGHAFIATVLNFVGRAEEALGHTETAMRLNPNFPFWYYYALGASQFMLTRYDAAVENFEKAVERNPTWLSSHRILVAAYGHLGRIDDAEWEMEELRALGFEPTIENWKSRIQYEEPTYFARYIEGLRKAGVPER